MTKKKRLLWLFIGLTIILLLFAAVFIGFFVSYRRPYRETVKESGLDENLVYAVMKAESGFREGAKSRAGAIGLMQVLPSTAQFVCEINGLQFDIEKLTDGKYNVKIGCLYLTYLLERFPVTETALCAYNAGEGTVSQWLADTAYSTDGLTLIEIPYSETRAYVKKIMKFRKIYEFFD
ncbi:MAG: lytic transglycosylase domain-containing protein [Clostridia bacterium]|nr:lytic transglycosylase domain-containing protein [Clostridia bacterium]